MSTREEFIQDMLDYAFTSKSLEEVKEEVVKLISHHTLNHSHRLLDISYCGGIYGAEFAKQGFNVTICEPLQLSIERQSSMPKSLKWIHQKPLELRNLEKFDLIINLNYEFGAFSDETTDQKLLSVLYSHLAPGGKLIMRLIGRDLLEKYFQPKFWVEHPDGSFLLNHRILDYDTGWLEDNYTWVKETLVKKYQCGMRLYYPIQLDNLLEQANFKSVALYGDIDKRPYDEKAKCMLVTAEKKEMSNTFIRC